MQALIAKGLPLKWESFVHSYELHVKQNAHLSNGNEGAVSTIRSDSKHVQFVRDLALAVSTLQNKTSTLISINDSVLKALQELKTCAYTTPSFQSHLEVVQTAVDKLSLENYANLSRWVRSVNVELKHVLQERLRDALKQWQQSFISSDLSVLDAGDTEGDKLTSIGFPNIFVEIMMSNQTIFLQPPLAFAKAAWYEHLEGWLGVLCSLSHIKASRYQITAVPDQTTQSDKIFAVLPSTCIDDLRNAHSAIDEKLDIMSDYVADWLRYQSLWDLQFGQLQDDIGEDLSKWHQLLQEIRDSRSTFDTSDVRKELGNVTFDYEQIQAKITQKYDQWQHDVTARFGVVLGNRMREVFADLQRARTDLENQALEASSTSQAVAFITTVQHCKRNANTWEPEIETFRQGQTTLSRQRHNFASDWLSANQVGDEWDAFREILDRKSRTVESQTDALRAKIMAEDQAVSARIADVVSHWAEEKPVSGTIAPEEATSLLGSYQVRLQKLQVEADTISKAKEALALPPSREDSLPAVLEEVEDFSSVWSALGTIWQNLNDLRDSLWNSVHHEKYASRSIIWSRWPKICPAGCASMQHLSMFKM